MLSYPWIFYPQMLLKTSANCAFSQHLKVWFFVSLNLWNVGYKWMMHGADVTTFPPHGQLVSHQGHHHHLLLWWDVFLLETISTFRWATQHNPKALEGRNCRNSAFSVVEIQNSCSILLKMVLLWMFLGFMCG